MQPTLSDGFSRMGLSVPDEAPGRFQRYYELLTRRNSVMNLTAISGEQETARLHFLDCTALLSLYDFSGKSVIDIGSGAGFPGIPLKLACPDLRLTLLDSRKKRVSFLLDACGLLGLDDVDCVSARAEDLALGLGGTFDVAVSRAVARLNVLCELCLPFVRVGGVFIAMKGPDCEDELLEASNAIKTLGGASAQVKRYTIPRTDIVHSALIIAKTSPTPPKYPRQYGAIKKSPL